MYYQRPETPALLNGVDAAARFLAPSFPLGGTQERLVVAHLDGDAHCIGTSEHDGLTSSVDLPLRTIIADMVRLGSAGLVIAHNHPGGDTRPSRSDCAATQRLALACDAMDVSLFDHLIFGADRSCSSMRRMGYL